MLGTQVNDMTGLKGSYDFVLDRGDEGSTDFVSWFTAVEEQLGLRLEPQKVQDGRIVIDHIERPTLN